MGDMIESSAAKPSPPPPSRQPPFREDCWTEEASSTLVDRWGSRYMELNRGNLRQKDWQEVAGAVNALHGHSKKTHRTDVQCKNRIDTLKKKYKLERMKLGESDGILVSSWPLFSRMDHLIGPNFYKQQNKRKAPRALARSPSSPLAQSPPLPVAQSPPLPVAQSLPLPVDQNPPLLCLPAPPMAVPIPYRKLLTPAIVTPVILPQKRPNPIPSPAVILPQKRPMPIPSPAVDESFSRKNYSAMASAAAVVVSDEEGDEVEESEESEDKDEDEGDGGLTRVAKAMERFSEVFERVEKMKQRQMIDLEKQRMQFAKDLEVQRMQLFMDAMVQMERVKRAKRGFI